MEDYISFVKVTRESLMDFIESYQERIIIAKPGYFEDEIDTIVNQVKAKAVEVRLYIE